MKKRKSPVLLVSMLVALLGIGAVYTVAVNSDKKAEVVDSTKPVLAEGSSTPNAENLKNSVLTAQKLVAPDAMQNSKTAQPEASVGPSIALDPKNTNAMSKPRPNLAGSSTSQWYSTTN